MNENGCMILGSIIALIVFILLCAAAPAHFEARAYERVTGKKVSTWDAIWLELRVTP